MQGSGIFDSVKSFFSAKQDFSNQSKQTLQRYGNTQIQKITIIRRPVESIVMKALDLLSLGKFSNAQSQQSYDKMMHLGLLITLQNSQRVIIEKVDVVIITDSISMPQGTEFLDLPYHVTKTLNQFVESTLNAIGRQRFFIYNAFNQNGGGNCQTFVLDLLKCNGISSPQITNFVFQNIDEIAKKLPSYVPKVTQYITDVGQTFAKLTGKGIRMKNARKHYKKHLGNRQHSNKIFTDWLKNGGGSIYFIH